MAQFLGDLLKHINENIPERFDNLPEVPEGMGTPSLGADSTNGGEGHDARKPARSIRRWPCAWERQLQWDIRAMEREANWLAVVFPTGDDMDEDNVCAIMDRWTLLEREIRRKRELLWKLAWQRSRVREFYGL